MKGRAPDLTPLGTLLDAAAPFRRTLAAAVALSLASVAAGLVPYVLVSRMIHMVISQDARLGALVTLALAALCAQLLKAALSGVSTGLSHGAAFGILEAMRERLAAKMYRMPLGEAAARSSGQYKALLVDTVEKIELPLAHLVPEVTADLLAPLAALCYLAVLDWRLALASLATLPAGALSYAMMTRDYRARYGRVSEAAQAMNSAMVEYVTGLEVIRAFNRGSGSYGRFRGAVLAARDAQLDWCRATRLWYAVGVNVAPATLTAVLPLGTWLHLHGSLDLATLVTATLLSLGLVGPLLSALEYTDSLAMVGDALGEVGALLNARETDRPECSAPPPGDGAALEGAGFSYGEGQVVLAGLDLELPGGTVTALVGPSGGGKSTAARLVAGHLDPDTGRVVIGGADARGLSLEAQMDRVSYMAQESWLFDWSVMDNIRLGRPGASDSEVFDAARLAMCHDFIEGLPRGYLTRAGEGGSRLSGGERQRVALARAVLKGSPVAVLDEATAYADPENELMILRGVAGLARGRTVLAIAHRLSSVAGADQIVVMDGGRAVARGTHGELLETSPLYASMWAAHVWEPDAGDGAPVEVPGAEAPDAVDGAEAPVEVAVAEAPDAVGGAEVPVAGPGAEAPDEVAGAEAPVEGPGAEAPDEFGGAEAPVAGPGAEAPDEAAGAEAADGAGAPETAAGAGAQDVASGSGAGVADAASEEEAAGCGRPGVGESAC
ncbi:MAG: ATP-binding cassette domain-containing protein [Deltaproteobacteria bacterium]|nr:ATP-binding cassette domain-containing protein [Deltaproteobacteria bacterium]